MSLTPSSEVPPAAQLEGDVGQIPVRRVRAHLQLPGEGLVPDTGGQAPTFAEGKAQAGAHFPTEAVAGIADDLATGAKKAAETIDSGKAAAKLHQLATLSNSH